MDKEVKFKIITLYRSDITGRTVTEEYAKKNAKNTVKEVTKVPI